MPIVNLLTNLAKSELPSDFVINFNKFLAPTVGKDLESVFTACFTDQSITTGANEHFPMILMRVWAINAFGDLEKRNRYSVEIYKFLKQEFPHLDCVNFLVLLHDMPQADVGPRPNC